MSGYFMNDNEFWDSYTEEITKMAHEYQLREYMEMQAMYLDNQLEC